MAIPVSELQSINPSSLIELFTLELFNNLHGSNDVLRFHSGTKMNTNTALVFVAVHLIALSLLLLIIVCTVMECHKRVRHFGTQTDFHYPIIVLNPDLEVQITV